MNIVNAIGTWPGSLSLNWTVPVMPPLQMRNRRGDAHDRQAPDPQEERPQHGVVIQVLLVDDHRILREGLAGLLSEHEDVEVIGEAADGVVAVEMARGLKPDVIVMDVSMPRMNGIEATRLIKQESPGIRIIGLSMHEMEDMAKEMFKAGADAYLTKGGPADDLMAAIRGAT